MSLNGISCETISDDGSYSRNVTEISNNFSTCSNVSTLMALERYDCISESTNLGDNNIIEGNTENRIQKYETISRKRKDKVQCVVEETVFNYQTNMYEGVKKKRLENEDNIFKEEKTSTNDINYGPKYTQNPAQLAELPAFSDTINCKSCHFKALSKQQLKFHLFKAHLRQGKYLVDFRCKICQYKTNDEQSMFLHQNDHEIKEEFASDISLYNNVEIDIVINNFKLDVENCEEIQWLESIKNYGGSLMECFDCMYVAKKRESLQNHAVQHENSNFTCNDHHTLTTGCPKCIYKCCLLMLPYKLLKCKCGFKTCKSEYWVRHKNRVMACTAKQTKLRTQDKAKKNQHFNGTNKELKCYHCSYLTNSRDSLKWHAAKHYKQDFNCDLHSLQIENECTKCIYEAVLVELESGEVYSCQSCNFKTLRKIEFSRHQNNSSNCGDSQTVTLCSDDSEDAD